MRCFFIFRIEREAGGGGLPGAAGSARRANLGNFRPLPFSSLAPFFSSLAPLGPLAPPPPPFCAILHQSSRTSSSKSTMEEPQPSKSCFICLSDGADAQGELPHSSCACPSMTAHRLCRARWSLRQAGRAEESACRFCGKAVPSWQHVLLAASSSAGAGGEGGGEGAAAVSPSPAASATMAVVVGDQCYKINVSPGPEGKRAFLAAVRILLGLPQTRPSAPRSAATGGSGGDDNNNDQDDDNDEDGGSDVDCTFEAFDPVSGAPVKLHGIAAFEAAAFCASISAAKRGGASSGGSFGGRAGGGIGDGAAAAVPAFSAPLPPPPLLRSGSVPLAMGSPPASSAPPPSSSQLPPMPPRPRSASGPRRARPGVAVGSSAPPQPPSSLLPPPSPLMRTHSAPVGPSSSAAAAAFGGGGDNGGNESPWRRLLSAVGKKAV